MQKFRTTSESPHLPSSQEIVEGLLVEAGSATQLPTDENKLLHFLKLKQLSFDFMQELDFLPREQKASLDLRAALSLNDRIVATQSGLNEKRKRFGIFHEIGHFILPEHRDKLFLDNESTLSWWTKSRMEREANEIAAELLFQGSRFTEEALSSTTSARVAIDLAPKYGASFESAMRRYVEKHVLPCAVIIYDKIKRESEEADIEDAEYKIHYTITSQTFRNKYFSGIEIKGGTVSGNELSQRGKWWGVDDIAEQELVVGRGEKNPWHFQTELFSNGYKVFQFVLPPKKKS
jgi:Zn-dependent peptidase ImmA (M78 family)